MSPHIHSTCSNGHTYEGNQPCPFCFPEYNTFAFRSSVWLYPGHAAWHFITLPQGISQMIKERFGGMKRGWGSLPVTITLGKTQWKSSIFPDRKAGSYLLPVKADVRQKEGIVAGMTIDVIVQIRE